MSCELERAAATLLSAAGSICFDHHNASWPLIVLSLLVTTVTPFDRLCDVMLAANYHVLRYGRYSVGRGEAGKLLVSK